MTIFEWVAGLAFPVSIVIGYLIGMNVTRNFDREDAKNLGITYEEFVERYCPKKLSPSIFWYIFNIK